ncbi:MAG TPA: putative porin [Clostridia bacterium]|nr:putative porin [Clostridia bacterium]
MKPQTTLVLILAAVACACPLAGSAQSADALIDKLVDKGILTVNEANELREETDKNFTQAYSVKTGLPDWVSSMKFNGDFRGRFEGFYTEDDLAVDRNRLRYRLRYGVTVNFLQGFEAGLRLGSGDIDSYPASGIDPISNNQTFQNNGSKKGIFLDLAYGRWLFVNRPAGTALVTLGKMENPFTLTDLVFDHDYTPEGLAAQFTYKLADGHSLQLNSGAFVLDEISASTSDPALLGAQLLYQADLSKKISLSAGATFLAITSEEQLANNRVPNINAGNTRNADGTPAFDFNPVVADLGVTYTLDTMRFYNGAFPIRLAAEYIYNGGAPSRADNDAWAAGITFGKAGKRKTWEASYHYKWLGANAWWEELVDSDFGAFWASPQANSGMSSAGYAAGTNVRGHVVRLAYAPTDFLTLSTKFIYTHLIDDQTMTQQPPPSNQPDILRLQIDASLKF